MTSSTFSKKFISVATVAMIAIGGSLLSATSASAAVSVVTSPVVTPTSNDVAVDGYLSATSYATFSGVPNNYGGGSGTVMKWLICDSAPSVTSAVDGSDVPYSSSNCQDVYTNLGLFTGTGLSLSSVTALGSAGSTIPTANLIGKYVVRLEMSKNIQNQTIYGWAMSSPKRIVTAPTMTGPSGNVNGAVGTAMAMAAYTTTGLTSPVVFSYAVGGGQSLPAGVSFDTTTGQITGTPTAAASNLSVTVTATGANGLTKFSVFNYTVTGGSNNNNLINNPSTPTQLVAPTISVVGTSAIATAGTYSSGTVMGNWEYCLTAKAAVTAPGSNPPSSDCGPLFVTSSASSYSNVAHALTLDLTATYYARPLGSMSSTLSAISLSGKFVRYQEFNSAGFFTATVPAAPGSVTSTDVTDTPIAENQRPLPVWASTIVKSIPSLTKALATSGGQVALTGGDYADLKSVTVGGKAIAFKIETSGNVSIPVPAGEAGKTADIVIVFAGGTMTVQDGIKYVAVTDVAKVAERPIAIAAGVKKLTEAAADQIRQAAFSNLNNTTIQCVAYASSNRVAAKAAAKLTAVQACGIAVKANPALKAADISVIVNKAKAKKVAVGIKVYK